MADARRRAEREARTSRRLRELLAGLAVVLVLALVAGGLALTLRGRAERQALVADAGRLGALAQTEDEIDRSVLLARQAVALDDTLERRGDLLAALLRKPAADAVMRAHLDGIGPLSLSADGRLLAMGDFSGRMAIFDVRSRRPLPGGFQAQAGVGDLALSLDGSLLAVARRKAALSSSGTSGARRCAPDEPISPTAGQLLRRPAVPGHPLRRRPPQPASPRPSVPLGRRHRQATGRAGQRLQPGRRRLRGHPDGTRLVVVNGAEVVQVAPGPCSPSAACPASRSGRVPRPPR